MQGRLCLSQLAGNIISVILLKNDIGNAISCVYVYQSSTEEEKKSVFD